MILESGTNYEANVTLGFLDRLASNEQVKAKFESVGFTQVQVTGSGGKRIVKGRWNGATRETEIPSQISNIRKV